MAVIAAHPLLIVKGFQPLFGTETVIGFALFHQLFGIGLVKVFPLALHVGAILAAHIRAFIML